MSIVLPSPSFRLAILSEACTPYGLELQRRIGAEPACRLAYPSMELRNLSLPASPNLSDDALEAFCTSLSHELQMLAAEGCTHVAFATDRLHTLLPTLRRTTSLKLLDTVEASCSVTYLHAARLRRTAYPEDILIGVFSTTDTDQRCLYRHQLAQWGLASQDLDPVKRAQLQALTKPGAADSAGRTQLHYEQLQALVRSVAPAPRRRFVNYAALKRRRFLLRSNLPLETLVPMGLT